MSQHTWGRRDSGAPAQPSSRFQPRPFSPSLSAGLKPPPDIQRHEVKTLGGTFKDTKYEIFHQQGEQEAIGADLWLDFMPNGIVQKGAQSIGLVQTVKTLKSGEEGIPKIPSTPESSPFKAEYKLKSGDVGRGIDQFDVSEFDRTNTSPLYAAQNRPSGSSRQEDAMLDYQTDLAFSQAAVGLGQHWKSDRPKYPATLIDRPRSVLDFPEQAWRQTFEVTALVTAGKLADTYLGSVAWGVEKPAGEKPRLSPSPISLVRVGAPSSDFMEAAKSWNTWNGGKRDLTPLEQELTDKGQVDVVPLPLTTNQGYSHHLMTDNPDILIIYIAQAMNALMKEDIPPVDKKNTKLNVDVMVDELVRLKGGKNFEKTFASYISTQLGSSFSDVVESLTDMLEFIFI